MGLFTFNKIWDRSDNWGILVVRPGTVPLTSNEVELVSAVAHLESLSFLEEAKIGYESILKKFPRSLGAYIGLGNIYFNQKKFAQSVSALKKAAEFHPDSAEARHNLSVALEKLTGK